MKKLLALILALVMSLSLVACGGSSEPAAEKPAEEPAAEEPAAEEPAEETPAEETAAPTDVKIGLICVHDENSGYDAAHIDGLKTAVAELGLDESALVIKYNIPEDETCYDTAVDLAEEGCTIIFSDSYGHQSYMMQAATEFPEVVFVADTGDLAANSGLDNYKNLFTYVYESRYVSGVVAGMKLKELMDAGTVTDPYIGYVGAFPYAEVVSGYTAFFLGIQSIVPEAHMDVQYTNSWYDPTAEAEAANALMSRGCVIIGQHADSTGAPSAVQAALDAGTVAYSVGYNIDMLSVAPTAALTSAQNNWSVIYKATLEKFLAGEEIPTDYAAGYADGAVMISALGESCAEGTQEAVDAAWAGIADGSLKVFDTSKFTAPEASDGSYVVDADGHVTSAFGLDADGDFVNDNGEAIADGAFVESVLRAAPYFSLRIDGITELN
ncbi:MAG: BMP family ABC transporter substrate-binding protein [Candidatus Onthomonas sp.]